MSTTLTQHLPIIEAASSELPGNLPEQLGEVIQEAHDYRQSVDAYLKYLDQKTAGADDLMNAVEKALKALKDKAEAEQPLLEKALQGIDDALEQGLDALETEEGQLKDGIAAAGKSMNELQAKLAAAGPRAQAAQQKATGRLQDAAGELESSQGEIAGFVEQIATDAGAVEELIAKAEQKIAAAMDALQAKMEEYQGYVGDRTDKAQTRLSAMAATHSNEMREAMESLVSKSTALFSDLAERVQKQRSALTGAMEEVSAAVKSLGTAMGTAGTDSAAKREEVDGPHEMLDASVPAMKILVDKVKAAADDLSKDLDVTWPHP